MSQTVVTYSRKLRDDAMVAKLFTELGPFYKNRPGGYVRILKAGFRTGDKAPMAVVQLVDFESGEEIITEAPQEETSRRILKEIIICQQLK